MFNDQQLSDLLTSALEGGSNYWYLLEEYGSPAPYWERVFTEGLLISNGVLVDKNTDEYAATVVNRAVMLAALELMHAKYPRHYADLIQGNDDAETADVFLQLCVLGEVLYG